MEQTAAAALEVHFDLAEKVRDATGITASACYQCRKCTNGCPLTFAMDHYPDRIVRLLLLGQEEEVLHSATIWVCSSCETCTTRCPNDIDIAGLMDHLKSEAHRRGIVRPKGNSTYAFHKVFLDDIARRGRVFESGLLNRYLLESGEWKAKLETGALWGDLRLGWALFRRGRLPLFPHGVKNKQEIRSLIEEEPNAAETEGDKNT